VSDERLRQLERRFKETGSAVDEARWLAERLSVGELTEERLALAAHAGSEAARIALADAAPTPEDDVELWCQAFERFGFSVCFRAALGMLDPPLLAASASVLGGGDASARAVRAFEDWTDCPCDDHATAAQGPPTAIFDFLLSARLIFIGGRRRGPNQAGCLVLEGLVSMAQTLEEKKVKDLVGGMAFCVARAHAALAGRGVIGPDKSSPEDYAALRAHAASIRARVRDRLVPWALAGEA
jgi:hypothetical protein